MPFSHYRHTRAAACLIMLLTLAGLAACGSTPDEYQITPVQITLSTPVPTLTPPPKIAQPFTSDLRTRWLAGKPCAPPCWEGITPGKTRLAEAIKILNYHPQITNIRVYPADGHDGAVIEWFWSDMPRGGGRLDFRWIDPYDAVDQQDVGDPIVTQISVSFSGHFSLRTIMDAYGEPSHVVPYAGLTVGIPHSGAGGGRPYYKR
jgi:hypothetical protein